MKKKKFRMSVILCILTLLLCVGIPQYSAISVKAAISKTSNKQTGFVKEGGSWYYYDKNGKNHIFILLLHFFRSIIHTRGAGENRLRGSVIPLRPIT